MEYITGIYFHSRGRDENFEPYKCVITTTKNKHVVKINPKLEQDDVFDLHIYNEKFSVRLDDKKERFVGAKLIGVVHEIDDIKKIHQHVLKTMRLGNGRFEKFRTIKFKTSKGTFYVRISVNSKTNTDTNYNPSFVINPYQSGLMSFSSHVSMNDVSLN